MTNANRRIVVAGLFCHNPADTSLLKPESRAAVTRFRVLLPLTLVLLGFAATAQAFKFSDDDEAAEKAQSAAKAQRGPAVSAACRARLKNERVLVLVAERGNNGMNADQGRYGLMFQGLDRRLRNQGMRTFSQDEIKKQVAQAEIDAYFRNDPDAALAASKKLGASLSLRGVISSRRAVNPVLRINEVYVNIGFTLIGADGRVVSEAGAAADSYAGGDTLGMALTLLNEQADGVVGRLLQGYCARSGRKSEE